MRVALRRVARLHDRAQLPRDSHLRLAPRQRSYVQLLHCSTDVAAVAEIGANGDAAALVGDAVSTSVRHEQHFSGVE